MATRMQQRRGTASQWTIADPVLAAGEIGVESDTAKFKIGDGINTWSTLDYFSATPDLTGYATEAYADQAEADAISTAASDATTKANTAESNANSYTDTAISNLVDSAPGTLDTLNELAAALNDDPAFFTNISSTITSGDSATLASANSYTDGEITTLDTSLKAYADQAEADAIATSAADATTKANAAENNASSYTDTAIANLVDTAPATLDTLNELAAALGDDPNFATTITNSIATKQDDVITTQGDLVVGDALGNPVRLPVGSADQVLTSDGNTISFQDASSGSQTLIQSAVAQSGTSTSFTNLPQDFKHLMIVVTQNAGSNLFQMSMSDNRGDYLFVIIQADNQRRTTTDFFFTSSLGDIGQSTIFLYNYASAGITQAMAASAGTGFSSGTNGGFGSTFSSGNTSSLTFDFSQTCTKTIEIYGVN